MFEQIYILEKNVFLKKREGQWGIEYFNGRNIKDKKELLWFKFLDLKE